MILCRRHVNARSVLAVASMVVIAVAVSPVSADDPQTSWQPDPPMPDDFDWIQLTSGEWLKGELTAMYEEVLTFDSDELDELTLDWGDIQQIRTAQVMQVAFLNKTIAVGPLLMEGDTIRVMDLEYERSQVLSITAGAPRERNYWGGKVSAGLNVRTGNTEQTEYNASATVVRRSPKNRINLDYMGNFSETDGTTIADNQRANVAWNRFISDRFYVLPAYGEYFRDPFQNIANRWSFGVGAGYDIVDTSRIDWTVNAGLAYQMTKFDDVPSDQDESESSPALVVATSYDNQFTGWVNYSFDYRLFVVNEASGSYTHHLVTGFEFEFFSDFDLDMSWVWDRIQDPRQNADGSFPEQDDFRTIVSLGYSF